MGLEELGLVSVVSGRNEKRRSGLATKGSSLVELPGKIFPESNRKTVNMLPSLIKYILSVDGNGRIINNYSQLICYTQNVETFGQMSYVDG